MSKRFLPAVWHARSRCVVSLALVGAVAVGMAAAAQTAPPPAAASATRWARS